MIEPSADHEDKAQPSLPWQSHNVSCKICVPQVLQVVAESLFKRAGVEDVVAFFKTKHEVNLSIDFHPFLVTLEGGFEKVVHALRADVQAICGEICTHDLHNLDCKKEAPFEFRFEFCPGKCEEVVATTTYSPEGKEVRQGLVLYSHSDDDSQKFKEAELSDPSCKRQETKDNVAEGQNGNTQVEDREEEKLRHKDSGNDRGGGREKEDVAEEAEDQPARVEEDVADEDKEADDECKGATMLDEIEAAGSKQDIAEEAEEQAANVDKDDEYEDEEDAVKDVDDVEKESSDKETEVSVEDEEDVVSLEDEQAIVPVEEPPEEAEEGADMEKEVDDQEEDSSMPDENEAVFSKQDVAEEEEEVADVEKGVDDQEEDSSMPDENEAAGSKQDVAEEAEEGADVEKEVDDQEEDSSMPDENEAVFSKQDDAEEAKEGADVEKEVDDQEEDSSLPDKNEAASTKQDVAAEAQEGADVEKEVDDQEEDSSLPDENEATGIKQDVAEEAEEGADVEKEVDDQEEDSAMPDENEAAGIKQDVAEEAEEGPDGEKEADDQEEDSSLPGENEAPGIKQDVAEEAEEGADVEKEVDDQEEDSAMPDENEAAGIKQDVAEEAEDQPGRVEEEAEAENNSSGAAEAHVHKAKSSQDQPTQALNAAKAEETQIQTKKTPPKHKAAPPIFHRRVSVQPPAPKRMPLRQAPKHDYTQLPDVPDWLKDKENRAYEAYAKNPPPGHKPFQEGWRWRARRTHELQLVAEHGDPEQEVLQDRLFAAPVRQLIIRLRDRADQHSTSGSLPAEVPANFITGLSVVYKAYKHVFYMLSQQMRDKLGKQVMETVLYIDDKYRDPSFNRKAARHLDVWIPPDLTVNLLRDRADAAHVPRPPPAKAKPAMPPKPEKRSITSDDLPRKKNKKEYSSYYPVDDVDFSQNSIGERFSCGRRLSLLVQALFHEEVTPEKDGFLRLHAMKVGDRLISRNNRRLWCLKEYQNIRRRTNKSFTVKVFLNVTEMQDRNIQDFIEARTYERSGVAEADCDEDEDSSCETSRS